MKIAISGKGGTGKTTLAAALALLLAQKGGTVLAVDADPDPNLATALGISPQEQAKIRPIAREQSLIEERTGATPGFGAMFRLNPEVKDIAEKYAFKHAGVNLLILGAVERGGSGCACPGSTLLRSLVQDLVLHKDESLILDMEAGIEHLGRATAGGVDLMLIVTEPGQRSIESSQRILRFAKEIGLKRFGVVANRVSNSDDEKRVSTAMPEIPLIGSIPLSKDLAAADRAGISILDGMGAEMQSRFEEILKKISG